MDGRPARTLLAIIVWVIAAFIIVNNIILEKPLEEWWLPLILVIAGLVLALYPGRQAADIAVDAADEEDALVLAPVAATLGEAGHEAELAAAIEAAVADAPIEAETVAEVAPVPVLEAEEAKAPVVADAPAADVITSPEEQHRATVGVTTGTVDVAEAESVVGFSTLVDGVEAVEESTEVESPPTDADPEALSEEAATVTEEAEPAAEQTQEATPEPIAEEITEPVKAPSKRAKKAESAGDGPDDLTKIEGIGPKMSGALTTAGIDTFAKLSQSSEDELRAAIAAAGMRFAPSVPTWAEQAAYAANGDWDGLKSFQDQLVGGRRRS